MNINVKHREYTFRRVHARISGFGSAVFLDVENYFKKSAFKPVVEKSIIAYLLEALREYVQKETADKLRMGYSDRSGFSCAVIPCIKSDL